MRKFYGLVGMFLIAVALMGASPAVENNSVVRMTAAGQATTGTYQIDTVLWIQPTSSTGNVINGTHTFQLTNTAKEVFISGRGTTDMGFMAIPVGGMTVTGISTDVMDAGQIFIYGKRK